MLNTAILVVFAFSSSHLPIGPGQRRQQSTAQGERVAGTRVVLLMSLLASAHCDGIGLAANISLSYILFGGEGGERREAV